MTSWLMSPCAKAGELTCLHCHTSSGRYRFTAPDTANNACMPCHAERVQNPRAHTHHDTATSAGLCVSCHMPTTEHARMRRSDHSMRPPMPAATLAFGSPNACNGCHQDKDAAWADAKVREWHPRDYQATTLEWARLVDDARKSRWASAPAMAAYLRSAGREEVVASSLVRLLRDCDAETATLALIAALHDPSPLVRASAADSLGGRLDPGAIAALAPLLRDSHRLVRVRAAGTLATAPADSIPAAHRDDSGQRLRRTRVILRRPSGNAANELARGDYLAARGRLTEALAAYRTALRLRPGWAPAREREASLLEILKADGI